MDIIQIIMTTMLMIASYLFGKIIAMKQMSKLYDKHHKSLIKHYDSLIKYVKESE
jgi:hypothetical protein